MGHPGWPIVEEFIDERLAQSRGKLETDEPGPKTVKVQGAIEVLKALKGDFDTTIRDGENAAKFLAQQDDDEQKGS